MTPVISNGPIIKLPDSGLRVKKGGAFSINNRHGNRALPGSVSHWASQNAGGGPKYSDLVAHRPELKQTVL